MKNFIWTLKKLLYAVSILVEMLFDFFFLYLTDFEPKTVKA